MGVWIALRHCIQNIMKHIGMTSKTGSKKPQKKRVSNLTQLKRGIAEGYRSGLEDSIAEELTKQGVNFAYEELKIEWEDLAYRKYTPDFVLPNNIIIESKGRFTAADRRKHLLVKKQHPELDIRFVFTNSNARLRKGATSTYATWCKKHGYKYADKSIPKAWIDEAPKPPLPDGLVKFKGTKVKEQN